MSRNTPRWVRALPHAPAPRRPAPGRRTGPRLSEMILAATAAALLIAAAARLLLAVAP